MAWTSSHGEQFLNTAVAIFNFTIQRLIFISYYDMLIIIGKTTYLLYNEDFQIEQRR